MAVGAGPASGMEHDGGSPVALCVGRRWADCVVVPWASGDRAQAALCRSRRRCAHGLSRPRVALARLSSGGHARVRSAAEQGALAAAVAHGSVPWRARAARGSRCAGRPGHVRGAGLQGRCARVWWWLGQQRRAHGVGGRWRGAVQGGERARGREGRRGRAVRGRGGVGPGCARQREREGKERKGKELGRRKRKRGKGEEGREKGGHAPAAIAGRAASGRRPRVGSAPGRKRRDSRRDRGARSATHGAWSRVSATRGSREKQGAGYGCRDKSFGNQEIGTGRFPKSWG